MEKQRRRRINTCLEQLRALLPFTATMKRDMASLLEQAVEYINTMHTVLNEEKPTCLSKIYTVYQSKLEEHDFFKKGGNKSGKKRNASGGSCSSAMDIQPTSSLADHTEFHPIPPEQLHKRRCVTIEEGARYNAMPPELLPQGHSQFYHGWPAYHQVGNMESVHDYSNAYLSHNGISCVSDERQGSYPVHSRSNDEDLAQGHQFNQYGGYHYDRDRQAPLVSQYPKIYGLSDSKMADAACTPSNSGFDAGLAATEMVLGGGGYQLLEDMRLSEEADRARKIPNYSISSLVYKDDGQQPDPQKADCNKHEAQRTDEACSSSSDSRDKTGGPGPNDAVTVNMVQQATYVPTDLTVSPRLRSRTEDTTPSADRKCEVSHALSGGSAASGILMRPSLVSRMLNDVSAPTDKVPRGSFGSTEGKRTPMLYWLRSPSCAIQETESNCSRIHEVSKQAGKNPKNDGVVADNTKLIQTPDLKGGEASEE